MKRRKVESMGSTVQGVRLLGDKRDPEPETFRVCFPGGDVDVVRTTDNEYWVHVRVNRPQDGGSPDRVFGRLVDGRIDVLGKHAAETDPGDFANPDTYHVAMRVGLDDQTHPRQ